MAGIFDFLTGGGNSGGILAGATPGSVPAWADKLGLFGSTLADVGANLSGHPADATNIDAYSKQARIRQLLGGLNSTDPAIRKQSAMAAVAAGFDPTAMLNLTRPKIEHVGDDLVSSDPFDPTNVKTVYKAPPPLPAGYSRNPDNTMSFIPGGPGDPKQAGALSAGRRQPPPGYQYDVTGTRLSLIPGFLGAAGELAAAKRAPPKATAPGAINLPHPGSLY